MSAATFWTEFQQAEPHIATLDQREAMEFINEILQPIFPDLAAEIQNLSTENDPEGEQYELIFTAHGAIEHFQDVMALAQTAPKLKQFNKTTAFRLRAAQGDFGIRMDDFSLNTADVLVEHFADGALVGLQLSFAKPIDEEILEHAKHMAFIMLDHVLGEYDFAIKVGVVDFALDAPSAKATPLSQFPAIFDAFWIEDLQHTAIFPSGEHDWIGFTLSHKETPDEKIVVMRNESAQSLLARADLMWRLEVSYVVQDNRQLEQAREFEDQFTAAIEHFQEGISTQIVLEQQIRSMDWHVSDIKKASAMAQALVKKLGHSEVEISSEFDPQWRSYRKR